MRAKRKQLRTKRSFKKILIGFLWILAPILVGGVLFGLYNFKDILMTQIGIKKQEPIAIPVVAGNQIVDIEDELRKQGFRFDEVKRSSSSARIYTTITDKNDKITIVFSSERDIEWQVSSLQSILSRLTIEKKRPTLIDLRFNKPIVKF